MIDLTSRNINRLFFRSFKNADHDPTRKSFVEYYIPLLEIKDSNELFDNKLLLIHEKTNKKPMKN